MLVNLSNHTLFRSSHRCCLATVSHKHLFGGPEPAESRYLGEQFSVAPRFDRDDTLSNASLLLYIIFISEALWIKRAGLVGHCLASLLLLQSLFITQLRGPGGSDSGLTACHHHPISVTHWGRRAPGLSPSCRSLFSGHFAAQLHWCWYQVRYRNICF